MDVRGGSGGGGWGSGPNDSDGVKSPNLTWGDERVTYSRKSIDESHTQERAGDITIAVLPREEDEDETPVPMARNSCHELGCNLHKCPSVLE